MFTRPRALVAVGLLVLMCAFGVAAVVSTPDAGRGIGIWPVALATATLMVTVRPATGCVARAPGPARHRDDLGWVAGRPASRSGSGSAWPPRSG